jgi:hypothetical protein
MGGGPAAATTGQRGMAQMSLRQSRRNYGDAIAFYLRKESYDSAELIELERKLLETYYLEFTAESLADRRRDAVYQLGRQSHHRLVAYAALGTGSVSEFSKALVELGDWELLFSRNAQALRRYREAYQLLEEHGHGQALEDLFPDTPVLLPAYGPSPFETPDDGVVSRHVDLSFEVSRYGKGRKVAVVETHGHATAEIEKEATRLVNRNRFRPRLVDGTVSTGTYTVRYSAP